MVNYKALDATYSALAASTRRQMVERLIEGDATLSELAKPHAMSLPAVMKHVAKLERAGLVKRRKAEADLIFRGRYGPAVSSAREEVVAYQKQLKALGFYKGTVDGVVGRLTRSAVVVFQHTHPHLLKLSARLPPHSRSASE